MTDNKLPHWDLSNVFPGLESEEFNQAVEDFKQKLKIADSYLNQKLLPEDETTDSTKLSGLIGDFVEQLNEIIDQFITVDAYLYSFVSTDSYNTLAMRLTSEFEQVGVELQMLQIRFQSWVGKIAKVLPEVLKHDGIAKAHAFNLKEMAEQSKYLMSETEEALAAEMNLSGGNAWTKLQGTVVSQMSVDFELDGKVQKMPIPALINLHSHPDEDVRRRAYEAEIKAFESVKEPLAACMNGIKGTANTLNKRRGREDALHSSIDMARIDRETLNALLGAMEDSLPLFEKYFKAKAARLGKEKLAWWDVFAPLGKSDKTYSYEEAKTFILEHFKGFTPELAEFAKGAFDNNWIDAEQRDGKRGGAFCMPVPAVKESRIMCNFDGSFDQVSTVAHELGHGFHNYCAFQAEKTSLQADTPMTLAETASIMCETIIVEAALKQAATPEEELSILETSLMGSSQVIVDIYSRYLFEKEVFERREKADLSADEISEIMEEAQKASYRDGLDEQYLHKYMWTWKPHYYSHELSFYNYPYTFGLLFATGLYAIYQERGEAFVADYKNLLASTGEFTAAELADRFGIDIRTKEFWANSIGVIAKQIERYIEL